MQRLNYLMTEMNFLIDVFDFEKGDPRCKLIVQQQVEQIIETAAAKGLLDLNSEERPPAKASNEMLLEDNFEDYPHAYAIDDEPDLL